MANMYPVIFPRKSDGKRQAERMFFESCETQLDDSWTVIYSQDWIGKRGSGNERGEADFILLNPSFGLYIVEVKGGQKIYRENNIWYTIPHHSDKSEKIKNPFVQAADSKSVLWAFINKRLPHITLKDVIKHFVVFPGHTQVGDMGSEAPRAIICDNVDLRDLNRTVLEVYKYFGSRGKLSRQSTDEILRILLPTDSLNGERHLEYHMTRDEVSKFGEIETQNFEILASQKKLVILGGPGSDLPELAFREAVKFSSKGFRTLLLANSKLLAGAMNSRHTKNSENSGHLMIRSYVQHISEFWSPESGQRYQDAWSSWVENTKAFDVLIVCNSHEMPGGIFKSYLQVVKNDGRVYLFADRNLERLEGSATSCVPDYDVKNLRIESSGSKAISETALRFIDEGFKPLGEHFGLIGAEGPEPKFVGVDESSLVMAMHAEAKRFKEVFNIDDDKIKFIRLHARESVEQGFESIQHLWEISELKFSAVIGVLTPQAVYGASGIAGWWIAIGRYKEIAEQLDDKEAIQELEAFQKNYKETRISDSIISFKNQKLSRIYKEQDWKLVGKDL